MTLTDAEQELAKIPKCERPNVTQDGTYWWTRFWQGETHHGLRTLKTGGSYPLEDIKRMVVALIKQKEEKHGN